MTTISEKLQTIAATKEAIRTAINDKGVEVSTSEPFASYPEKIASIKSGGGGWTGHADADGLKAIGWTDEDIAYYQATGVDWNEEDDEYHKVSDANKALYGVVSLYSMSSYRDIMVYMPKVEVPVGATSLNYTFSYMYALRAIPILDTANITEMTQTFYGCTSLVTIPPLNLSNVLTMSNTFYGCYSLRDISYLYAPKVTSMTYTFCMCYSLREIPDLNLPALTSAQGVFSSCYALKEVKQLYLPNLVTASNMFENCYTLESFPASEFPNLDKMDFMFNACRSLRYIGALNVPKATSIGSTFYSCKSLSSISELSLDTAPTITLTFDDCLSLRELKINKLQNSINLRYCRALSKASLLYIINNEAGTSSKTITLNEKLYANLSKDADVKAALAIHTNVYLGSASI